MGIKHPRPEREDTDLSLGGEREKTDAEFAKRRADIEGDADKVVADARNREDVALKSARGKADEGLRPSDTASAERAVVRGERSREDDTLRRDRATADKELSTERGVFRGALAALLALERAQTDDHLLRERDCADDAIDSRDDFLAMVSHDLRNMLDAVVMSAALLEKIPCDDEVGLAITDKTRRIQRYAAQMKRLVSDLLDVVSIDAGRFGMVAEHNAVTDMLRETLEAFDAIAAAKKITIRTDAKAGAILARYDRERILQVLANLVGNAIKFTPEGGKVEILVEPVGHEVRFAVVDTGVGIAPDKLGVVFERFWQVAKQDRLGHGLGLYISRCIVEGHGGRIWVESRLREGSAFYFTLPGPEASSTLTA